MLDRSPAAVPICIEVTGDPRGKGRPRSRIAGNSFRQFVQVYTDPETRAYEDRLRAAAALAMHGHSMLIGAVEVRVEAHFAVPASWSNRKSQRALAGEIRPTGKPDWDNIGKVVDALNGIVWKDDSQVVDGRILKFYGDTPALRITVRPIAEPLFEAGAET